MHQYCLAVKHLLVLMRLASVAALIVAAVTCAEHGARKPPPPAELGPSRIVRPSETPEEPALQSFTKPSKSLRWMPPADLKQHILPATPLEIARAKKLLQRGTTHYRKGDYDRAEEQIKEAMTLYPFFAEANLLLGKIYLIRGSALHDNSMINNARLMFEMARKLDPSLRETEMLLELFLSTSTHD